MTHPRPGDVAHVAINSDDLDASRAFYEAVFGWRFAPWGPPGFFPVEHPDGGTPDPSGAPVGVMRYDDAAQ